MPNKLIVMMLDGISAEYFQNERARMPHISALAARGHYVRNLHSAVVGVSLAGRVGMMTGVTGAESAIIGNPYWDGERFRLPTPYDVRVPTLPERRAKPGWMSWCWALACCARNRPRFSVRHGGRVQSSSARGAGAGW
ncbi:MAG: alkaline phosphatase family protein [Chloroflexi bacterium]|nr:alkaline phosphatase family protein [Chloroflexota bacterium]